MWAARVDPRRIAFFFLYVRVRVDGYHVLTAASRRLLRESTGVQHITHITRRGKEEWIRGWSPQGAKARRERGTPTAR